MFVEHFWSDLAFVDPGSEIRDPGLVKIRIRDKDPGSVTLKNFIHYARDKCIFYTGRVPEEKEKKEAP
jgi:hypothetical protein